MSKRNERAACTAGALAALLMLPLGALAGVTADAPEAPSMSGAVAAKEAKESKPAGGFQLRCWQYGRLLFEESPVTLPADSARHGIKIAANDRNGKPLYLAEMGGATCLIRHAGAPAGATLPK